jgi:hypothetical protein
VLIRRHIGGNAPLVDERLVEPRRLAVREHVGDDVELGVLFAEHRR